MGATVELVTRMPGSAQWSGEVLRELDGISTVRWSDGAVSGVRTQFLRPAGRTATWSGTEASADQILDAVRAADDGYGGWRMTKRLASLLGHELILDTLSSVITLRPGDRAVKVDGVWVPRPGERS